MSRTPTAEIDGAMLVWARSVMRMSTSIAAEKIGVSEEKLQAWEEGASQPTVRQLRTIAKVYGQCLAAFYLPAPPADYSPKVRDYRRPAGDVQVEASAELLLDMRTSNEHRLSAIELEDMLGGDPKALGLTCRIGDNPEDVGAAIRREAGVNEERQAAWARDRRALAGWRSVVEQMGVLVFQTSKLPDRTVRGYSIAADRLPVIVLNRKEVAEGRTFTLLHELTHLMLHSSGVCDLRTELSLPPEEQRLEVFCNAVAGAALVPSDWLLSEVGGARATPRTWNDEQLKTLGNRFGVSREVVLRRLLYLGQASKSAYERFREAEDRKPRNVGSTSNRIAPARDTLSKLGRPYVASVLGARSNGVITAADASSYLGLRLKHFGRLSQIVGT